MNNLTHATMTELANAAFRQAAKKVIRRAIDTGTPIIVYQEGAIVHLDPRTMQPVSSLAPDSPQAEAHDSQQAAPCDSQQAESRDS